jgi:hypothetical protein
MRLFLYFYLITLHFSSLNAQDRHDFSWILGARSATPTNPDYGGTSISFKNGTFEADTFDISFRMVSHSMMCDADGNLQYYTNNCRIENKLHQTMDNGDNISPGFISRFGL